MGDGEWCSPIQASVSAVQALCVATGMRVAVLFPRGIGPVWEESTESSVRYSTLSEAVRRYMAQLAHMCHMLG